MWDLRWNVKPWILCVCMSAMLWCVNGAECENTVRCVFLIHLLEPIAWGVTNLLMFVVTENKTFSWWNVAIQRMCVLWLYMYWCDFLLHVLSDICTHVFTNLKHAQVSFFISHFTVTSLSNYDAITEYVSDFNSLAPSDATWSQRTWFTLVQVMICCMTAPDHYLNQCWLDNEVLWHSSESNFTENAQAISHSNLFENYTCRITTTVPKGQWVKFCLGHIENRTAKFPETFFLGLCIVIITCFAFSETTIEECSHTTNQKVVVSR